MKKFLALILSVVMALSLVACGGGAEAPAEGGEVVGGGDEKVTLTLATGGTSGTYYAVGGVMKTVLESKLEKSAINVESTGASVANVNMLTDGQAHLAILQSDVLSYAHTGTYSFETTGAEDSALWVAGIYNETVQILAKPGINSVADLKGKTICVGDVGSGTEINAWQVLSAAGFTKDDVNAVNGSFGDGVEQLKDGKIDAAFTVAGAPTTAITEYATTNEANLISLDEELLGKIKTEYPFLVQDNLPAGTYTGQDAEVVCVAIQATLVADTTVSEEVVYELTKAMYDNQAELTAGHAKWGLLNAEAAVAGATAPIHPGAEKYYKEIGVL
jgi:TRAP transporter TAXI family solute receptor